MNARQAHAFCAGLPGATLDHKWRFADSVHPVYSVGGRMFAMFSITGERLLDRILFKADDARFLELTDRDGIEPAPYLARAKWVRVEEPRRLATAELRALLAEAHAVVLAKLPKKTRAAIVGEPAAAGAGAKKTRAALVGAPAAVGAHAKPRTRIATGRAPATKTRVRAAKA